MQKIDLSVGTKIREEDEEGDEKAENSCIMSESERDRKGSIF